MLRSADEEFGRTRSGSRSSHVPGATLRSAFFAPDMRYAWSCPTQFTLGALSHAAIPRALYGKRRVESLGNSTEETAHFLFAVLRDTVEDLVARGSSHSSHAPDTALRGAFFASDTRFAWSWPTQFTLDALSHIRRFLVLDAHRALYGERRVESLGDFPRSMTHNLFTILGGADALFSKADSAGRIAEM